MLFAHRAFTRLTSFGPKKKRRKVTRAKGVLEVGIAESNEVASGLLVVYDA